MDVDLERLRVLVGGVLSAIGMIGGFPVERFYQEVGSRFQIARQLLEVQGFKRKYLLRKKART